MDQEMNRPPAHPQHSIGTIDTDEVKVCVVRKHPFGLLYLYILSAVGILGAFGLIGFVLPSLVKLNGSQKIMVVGLFMVAIIAAVLGLIVSTFVYRQSKLVVTDKNITQVLQRGLFNRKISQLSMANVEDVTAEQKGILALTFGYGVLRIETAGEQENFVFDFCPNPNRIAKEVLDARERFIEYDPARAERANHHLHV